MMCRLHLMLPTMRDPVLQPTPLRHLLWAVALTINCALPACKGTREALRTIELPKQAQPIARGAPTPAPQPLPLKPKPMKKPQKKVANKSPKASKAAARKAARARARKLAARVVPLETLQLPPTAIEGVPPRTPYPLLAVFARIRQISSVGEVRMIIPWLSFATRQRLKRTHRAEAVLPMAPRTLWQRLSGKVTRVIYNGQRASVVVRNKQGEHTLNFFIEEGGWRLHLSAERGDAPPPRPEPLIKLATAVRGVSGRGPLVAVFTTSAGRFRCKLHEGMAPNTVAHFVGLARGLLGPLGRAGSAKPFYDGLQIHRAAPQRFIQSGDPTELGTGGAGFHIADEFHPKLRHDRAGVLSMASRGAHTASSQFFVTLQKAPALDGRHNIFGQCRDLEVIEKIAVRAPRTVVLQKVRVQRDF